MDDKCSRRKHRRYSPPEGTVAALRPFGEKIGLVKDIGGGGLSFDYLILDTQNMKRGTVSPNGNIDILWPKKKTHLKGIPCMVVWENMAPSDKRSTVSIFFRRLGVSFQGPMQHERKLLDDFLAECKSAQV